MLILQRKAGESVLIGEDISVTVLSVDKGRVRLAITAPAQVPILRDELVIAAAANRDAAAEEASPQELLRLLGAAGAAERPAPLSPLPRRNGELNKQEDPTWN